jgi:hypothetical protein
MEVRLFSISCAPHQGCSGPISTHKARPESAMVLPPNFTSRRSHGGSAVCVLTHTQSQAGPTFLAMLLTWSLLAISSTCMPHRSIDRRRTCSCQQRAGMDLSIDQYTRPFPIRLMRASVHGWIFYDLSDVHRLGVELASAVSIHLTTHVPPSLATTLRSLDQHQVDDDVKMHGSI